MFKDVVTLLRGRIAATEEAMVDRNALLILNQQMRDTQTGVAALQRALATALAEEAQEARRHEAVLARIADLENRARAAIAAGQNELATEAAEGIAGLEVERDAGMQARAAFATEITRLRRAASNATNRLASLERGRRMARVAEAMRVARQGRMEAAPHDRSTMAEAEATLARLREQQAQAEAADRFLDEITEPTTLEDRLATAGCGPATRPTAATVLARLKNA